MKEFLFLFRGGEAGRLNQQQSPEQWQQHMMKWKNWMESLAKEGKFTAGQPLDNQGKVLTGTKKKLTDGPFVEGKEIVGGYVQVKAKDLDEATEIARGCPIFEHDGIVEIRPVGPSPM